MSDTCSASVGVIGSGAWGTALAAVAANAGNSVAIWSRNPQVVDDINNQHENALYLKGAALDPTIRATTDAKDLENADLLLLVTPSQHLRSVITPIKPLIDPDVPLVLCAKGVEISSGLLMSEMLEEVLPKNPLAVLSGPTFAIEVARDLPTAVTLACADAALGRKLANTLGSRAFRIYHSTDPVGAEIGGAVKNVIAIACGIVDGRQLGDNARAALITRGLSEIVQLGIAKGARRETLMGLAGMGDLTLTCTATQSRNYALGKALGSGEKLADYLKGRITVAEGLGSSKSVSALARKLQIDMPICNAICDVLHHQADIDQTIADLLARPQKAEF
ncbi:NAD(P)-dependent glycerol-3-phosphate dehydrogenase [Kiloniella laminariae]|uniref:Glycerol-3-phosphate dehydrogenase [NAD(P)+] n=1 Tax=Kiloniella laminariae TaxID=454162 RepID=A0ABT4LJG8_9PROT|nr:NAD(P)H-dependent glycerol-3-phosphate dehydrogenase [Kiloniella laminariae]MCZ4281085.1 NAD(P)-dependent glycerol-3-phosphate dehydrogenase [Kiloniella laminariae]